MMPCWFRRLGTLFSVAMLLAAGSRSLAQAEPPTVVVLVIDTSGSVGRAQLSRGLAVAEGLLKSLPPTSEVAVFTFDDASRLVVPRTSRAADVRSRLLALTVAGKHTALHDALYDASRYLRDGPGTRRAIVLITDGKDEDSALNLDDGLRLAQDAGIPVHVVGVGHPDERVLRRIAKLTGGSYAPISSARLGALSAALRTMEAAPVAAPPKPPPSAEPRSPTSAVPVPQTPATPASILPGPSSRGRALPWLLGALFALAVGVAILLVRRAATLPGVTAAPAPAPSPAAPRSRPAATGTVLSLAEDELSPTLLARMNVTEEYLEQTLTLRPRAVLGITRGADVGQVVELSEETAFSVGRAKANDLVVNDVAVSSQHCRIRPEEGGFVVHDLKSTNGTFVNERRVTSQLLAGGDVIKIGETHLQFRLDLKRS